MTVERFSNSANFGANRNLTFLKIVIIKDLGVCPILFKNYHFLLFSPDSLATTASSALVWLILEIGIIYLTLTVMSINTSLTKWDILSFSR